MPTRPPRSADRSNAWIDRRYRRADPLRNAFVANWPNSAVGGEGSSFARAVETGQPMSVVASGVPTARNGASRVCSGLAHVRPKHQMNSSVM